MVQLSSLLVTGADGRWHPGIGDPTAVGWLTVVAYFVAAALAYRALRLHRASVRTSADPQGTPMGRAGFAREETLLVRFWGWVLVTMLLLGFNKQLDLQTWFTEVARDSAHAHGWYHVRRPFQVAFIALIGLVGGAATIAAAFVMRHVLGRVVGALVGLGALVTFVVVRAASFHHVDVLLGRGRVRLNWVLELGGIALIAISAIRQSGRSEERQRDRPLA